MEKIQHPSEYFRSISYDVFKSPNWINTCLYWFKENKNKKFDLIITSFSPITNVLAANKALKYWPNAKLVVDHRDLISLQGQKIRIPVIHHLDVLFDKFFNRKSDGFITIGETTYNKAKALYKKPGLICHNGIEKEIQNTAIFIGMRKKLKIGYFGTLSRFRNPWPLISLLERKFVNQNLKIDFNVFSADNVFDYEGAFDPRKVNVNNCGYIEPRKVHDAMKNSDILTVLENPNPEGNENLTGKIFDYIPKRRPILAFCNKYSDIGNILRLTNSGSIVTNSESLDMFFETFIQNTYSLNKKGLRTLTSSYRAKKIIEFGKILSA